MARVLVVDDTAYMRTLMRLSLERGGHHVTEALDEAQALQYVQNPQFDIALIDVMMPGVDGLDLCRTAREAVQRVDGNLSIILVSANDFETEAMQAGADRFVLKPFAPSALLMLVDEFTRLSKTSSTSATL